MLKKLTLIFSTIGIIATLLLGSFIVGDTSIKFRIAEGMVKKFLGLGGDYSGFVADDYSDFYDLIKRGITARIQGNNYPTIDMILPFEEASKLDKQREDRSLRKWVKAKLRMNHLDKKKIFKVKVRSKGDRDLHTLNFETMSFKVDIKGKKRLFSLEEFSIQRPIIRNYGWELLISKFAAKDKILAPDILPINFYVNGSNRGIYIIEEGFGKEFLERRQRKAGPIFSLFEDLGTKFPDVHYEPYEESKINSETADIYLKAHRKLLDLKNTFSSKEFHPSKYFDLEKWGRYFAIIDLFSSYHGAVPKSVKLYFNPSTLLFEPVMFDNHLGGANYTNFSFLDFHHSNQNFNYDKCGFACMNSEWFRIFFSNVDFYQLYKKNITGLINRYESGYYSDLINDVEEFNNHMYSILAPSDRVFFAGVLPYYMDISHLANRARLIKQKLNLYDKTFGENKSIKEFKQFDEKSVLEALCDENLQNKKSSSGTSLCNNDISLIHKNNFIVKDEDYSIPENTLLLLTGKTLLENASIKSINSKGMLVQIGGEITANSVSFSNLSSLSIEGTNWTGAVNIINANATLDNVGFNGNKGEDALNTVDSNINIIGELVFDNIDQDAFDSDFSLIEFENISCHNVGNDCFDTSGSIIRGGRISGKNVEDKLASFGEGSKANITSIEGSNCGIGIAAKDSSYAFVEKLNLNNTPLEIALFNKKPFFGSSNLTINTKFGNHLDMKKYLVARAHVLEVNGIKIPGSATSKEVKEKLYGNIYGKASRR